MVIKPITVFLSVCLITMLLPFASYAAKVSPGSAEEERVNENNTGFVNVHITEIDTLQWNRLGEPITLAVL